MHWDNFTFQSKLNELIHNKMVYDKRKMLWMWVKQGHLSFSQFWSAVSQLKHQLEI